MTRAMAVLTILSLLGTMVLLKGELSAYADVVVGWSRQDVLYGFGRPTQEHRTPSGEVLVHERGGVSIASVLASGNVEQIRCAAGVQQGVCPPIVGIRGGDSEERVWQRLGVPSRIRYVGGDKVLDYDGLGLNIRLHRFAVAEIELRRATGGWGGFLGRWLQLTYP